MLFLSLILFVLPLFVIGELDIDPCVNSTHSRSWYEPQKPVNQTVNYIPYCELFNFTLSSSELVMISPIAISQAAVIQLTNVSILVTQNFTIDRLSTRSDYGLTDQSVARQLWPQSTDVSVDQSTTGEIWLAMSETLGVHLVSTRLSASIVRLISGADCSVDRGSSFSVDARAPGEYGQSFFHAFNQSINQTSDNRADDQSVDQFGNSLTKQAIRTAKQAICYQRTIQQSIQQANSQHGTNGGGGGFGGLGGKGCAPSSNQTINGGLAAGSPVNQPINLFGGRGSVGGLSDDESVDSDSAVPSNNSVGYGNGGGLIDIEVKGTFFFDCLISANGGNAWHPTLRAGGGAAGSIWISAPTITGPSTNSAASVVANGGLGLNGGGGGAGGRIYIVNQLPFRSLNSSIDQSINLSINQSNKQGKSGFYDVKAWGGVSNPPSSINAATCQGGGQGTIYLQSLNQTTNEPFDELRCVGPDQRHQSNNQYSSTDLSTMAPTDFSNTTVDQLTVTLCVINATPMIQLTTLLSLTNAIFQPIKQSNDQSINQSINQTIDPAMDQTPDLTIIVPSLTLGSGGIISGSVVSIYVDSLISGDSADQITFDWLVVNATKDISFMGSLVANDQSHNQIVNRPSKRLINQAANPVSVLSLTSVDGSITLTGPTEADVIELQSVKKSINLSNNQLLGTYRRTDSNCSDPIRNVIDPIDQSINQSINKSIVQTVNQTCDRLSRSLATTEPNWQPWATIIIQSNHLSIKQAKISGSVIMVCVDGTISQSSASSIKAGPGCPAGLGLGSSTSAPAGHPGAGAGHGGLGGPGVADQSNNQLINQLINANDRFNQHAIQSVLQLPYDPSSGPTYDNATIPQSVGSGGSSGPFGGEGGFGGGYVFVQANSLAIDQTSSITADGRDGSPPASGGGSGGSVVLRLAHIHSIEQPDTQSISQSMSQPNNQTIISLSSKKSLNQLLDDAGAVISANGGAGTPTQSPRQSFDESSKRSSNQLIALQGSGGGGGGGRLYIDWLVRPSINQSTNVQFSVSALIQSPAASSGEPGVIETNPICPPGKGGVMCHPCSPGSAKAKEGPQSCSLCQPGHYQKNSGQKSCEICPGGSFSLQNSTECHACPPAKWAPSGSGECSFCPPGNEPTPSKSYCQTCPDGTVTNQSVNRSTSLTMSQSMCELCPAGFSSGENHTVCSPCPPVPAHSKYIQLIGVDCSIDCVIGYLPVFQSTEVANLLFDQLDDQAHPNLWPASGAVSHLIKQTTQYCISPFDETIRLLGGWPVFGALIAGLIVCLVVPLIACLIRSINQSKQSKLDEQYLIECLVDQEDRSPVNQSINQSVKQPNGPSSPMMGSSIDFHASFNQSINHSINNSLTQSSSQTIERLSMNSLQPKHFPHHLYRLYFSESIDQSVTQSTIPPKEIASLVYFDQYADFIQSINQAISWSVKERVLIQVIKLVCYPLASVYQSRRSINKMRSINQFISQYNHSMLKNAQSRALQQSILIGQSINQSTNNSISFWIDILAKSPEEKLEALQSSILPNQSFNQANDQTVSHGSLIEQSIGSYESMDPNNLMATQASDQPTSQSINQSINQPVQIGLPHLPLVLVASGEGEYETPYFFDLTDRLNMCPVDYFGHNWFRFIRSINQSMRSINQLNLFNQSTINCLIRLIDCHNHTGGVGIGKHMPLGGVRVSLGYIKQSINQSNNQSINQPEQFIYRPVLVLSANRSSDQTQSINQSIKQAIHPSPTNKSKKQTSKRSSKPSNHSRNLSVEPLQSSNQVNSQIINQFDHSPLLTIEQDDESFAQSSSRSDDEVDHLSSPTDDADEQSHDQLSIVDRALGLDGLKKVEQYMIEKQSKHKSFKRTSKKSRKRTIGQYSAFDHSNEDHPNNRSNNQSVNSTHRLTHSRTPSRDKQAIHQPNAHASNRARQVRSVNQTTSPSIVPVRLPYDCQLYRFDQNGKIINPTLTQSNDLSIFQRMYQSISRSITHSSVLYFNVRPRLNRFFISFFFVCVLFSRTLLTGFLLLNFYHLSIYQFIIYQSIYPLVAVLDCFVGLAALISTKPSTSIFFAQFLLLRMLTDVSIIASGFINQSIEQSTGWIYGLILPSISLIMTFVQLFFTHHWLAHLYVAQDLRFPSVNQSIGQTVGQTIDSYGSTPNRSRRNSLVAQTNNQSADQSVKRSTRRKRILSESPIRTRTLNLSSPLSHVSHLSSSQPNDLSARLLDHTIDVDNHLNNQTISRSP